MYILYDYMQVIELYTFENIIKHCDHIAISTTCGAVPPGATAEELAEAEVPGNYSRGSGIFPKLLEQTIATYIAAW